MMTHKPAQNDEEVTDTKSESKRSVEVQDILAADETEIRSPEKED